MKSYERAASEMAELIGADHCFGPMWQADIEEAYRAGYLRARDTAAMIIEDFFALGFRPSAEAIARIIRTIGEEEVDTSSAVPEEGSADEL